MATKKHTTTHCAWVYKTQPRTRTQLYKDPFTCRVLFIRFLFFLFLLFIVVWHAILSFKAPTWMQRVEHEVYEHDMKMMCPLGTLS